MKNVAKKNGGKFVRGVVLLAGLCLISLAVLFALPPRYGPNPFVTAAILAFIGGFLILGAIYGRLMTAEEVKRRGVFDDRHWKDDPAKRISDEMAMGAGGVSPYDDMYGFKK
ncbi:MAG: hypothetical protein ACNS63_04370 [Candidatus Nitrospinota bacterium M3_3B_026]